MSTVISIRSANDQLARSIINSVPEPNKEIDLVSLISETPELLEYAISLILNDFDYEANKTDGIAVSIRILAALADRLKGGLQ